MLAAAQQPGTLASGTVSCARNVTAAPRKSAFYTVRSCAYAMDWRSAPP